MRVEYADADLGQADESAIRLFYGDEVSRSWVDGEDFCGQAAVRDLGNNRATGPWSAAPALYAFDPLPHEVNKFYLD